MTRSTLILRNGLELFDAATATNMLVYVPFLHPLDSLHLLRKSEYCWKEIQFEQRFHVGRHAALFLNWLSIFFASWLFIGTGFSFTYPCDGRIMSGVACWLPLRLGFSVIIPAWRFLRNVVASSFVFPSRSIVFMFCCSSSRQS